MNCRRRACPLDEAAIVGDHAGASGNLTINAVTTTGSGNVINGAITGEGLLTKIGTGILTLTGRSDYRGSTEVNAGTLAITGSLTGAVSAGANLTLSVNGPAAAAATLALSGSASVTMNSAFVG